MLIKLKVAKINPKDLSFCVFWRPCSATSAECHVSEGWLWFSCRTYCVSKVGQRVAIELADLQSSWTARKLSQDEVERLNHASDLLDYQHARAVVLGEKSR